VYCNPSYSGDKGSGGLQFENSPGIQFETLSPSWRKKKRAGGVAQGIDPEFKPQFHQKKAREMRNLKEKKKLKILN
jgi:hypothetical protein